MIDLRVIEGGGRLKARSDGDSGDVDKKLGLGAHRRGSDKRLSTGFR
jgi:hypothetical protein